MLVREGKVRQSYKTGGAVAAVPQSYATHTFPAPTRGLVVNELLANPGQGAALVLENVFPMQHSVRLRAGAPRHATVGARVVESFLTYRSNGFETLFAASDGKIFDVTAPADPDVVPTAAVTGQTSNYYSHTQFATAGGEYLIAVNGDDDHLVFDGSAWASDTPAITGISSDTFSQVWAYKSRLFFVVKNSLTAAYLPVDSIGGGASAFGLDGVFKRGGSLLFGATWSLDAGDGLDDKCVFVTDQGEVAIYEGSNPADATNWSLVGRYDISKPMGKNAFMQAGGDLLIVCVDGIIPISAAINKDSAALSLSAITRPIEPIWRQDVAARSDRPWEIIKWPEKNMAIISVPSRSLTAGSGAWGSGVWGTFVWGGSGETVLTQDPYCYVVNLQTGAWAKYTGWDVQSLGFINGQAYFGTTAGYVMKAESGGDDDGELYVCRIAGLFEPVNGMNTKTVLQARASWRYKVQFEDKISVSTNYTVDWPAAPSAAEGSGGIAAWDVAIWDEDVWDSELEEVKAWWVSIGRTGYVFSPMVQVTCGSVLEPNAELVAIDVAYIDGTTVA